jgi:preprotein translocase subunit SecE
MNRQTKRMMQRQKSTPADRAQAAAARRPMPQEKKKRTPPRQFLREVRQELKKVNWPTRTELIAYTLVVLVSVIALTSYVFGLDYVFSKAVLKVFGA